MLGSRERQGRAIMSKASYDATGPTVVAFETTSTRV
jgi:hypothetical protein